MECRLQNLVSLLFVRFALINTTSCFSVATSPIWVYIKKNTVILQLNIVFGNGLCQFIQFLLPCENFPFFSSHKRMVHFQGLSNTFLTRMCVFYPLTSSFAQTGDSYANVCGECSKDATQPRLRWPEDWPYSCCVDNNLNLMLPVFVLARGKYCYCIIVYSNRFDF